MPYRRFNYTTKLVFAYIPNDPGFLSNPFPTYQRMREEDPCHWSSLLKAWVLTRYDDVKQVCLDTAGMSSDRLRPFFATLPPAEAARIADLARYLTLWMVFRDPPEHTRLRRLAAKVFNVRSVSLLRPQIEAIAAWLLERLAGRDAFDGELSRLKRLSDEMALFIGSSRDAPDKYARAQAATREMAELFRELISARRAAPQRDLLTDLVNVEDAGERLSEDELVATCVLLLFAGHETTTHHIANGLLALLRFPNELARLRDAPGLAPAAVEELLRYDGPIGAQVRIVQQPQTLHGKPLAAGDRVFLMMNAANRDPRAYPDPDRLDLGRNGVPHLGFGFGAHICLGFPLARLEGQIALAAVLRRWRDIRIASPRLEWIDSMVLRGLKALPLEVGA